MLACRQILFLGVILICCCLPFPSSQAAEGLREKATIKILEELTAGVTKEFTANVQVQDCETNEPIWGARVELDYYRTASRPRITLGRCSGDIEAVTDRKGKVKLKLKVENCPHRIIMDKDDKEEERLYVFVSAYGYEETGRKLDGGKVNICLQKPGFKPVHPALQIGYPKYEIDYERFRKIFDEITEINKREIGEKIPKKSYVAWKYRHAGRAGSKGFDDFLQKIESFSSLQEIPFLKEILENNYPLPYKDIKFKDEESWRAGDYYYAIGRRTVSKALINIGDDQADELLPKATNIPEDYVKLLSEAGIRLSAGDYWDYLSGKYVSRAHNPLSEGHPRPDPLIFSKDKLKENLPPARYADYLFKLYQITSINSADEKARQHYNWQIDKDHLADELFGLRSPLFTSEVKKQLPSMQADGITRKYIYYLYKQGQYDHLVKSIKENKNLMKAFLAEDKKGTTSWDTATGERTDLEVEECLLTKMPLVTAQIKKEIESYMKEVSTNYSSYRWWIRNLSFINKKSAESIAREIYSRASVKPHKDSFKYEKRYVLRGAAEGKLTNLCKDVFDDLRLKDELKRDYFSVAQDRIYYLSSSCPREFKEVVSDFNVNILKDKIKSKAFESSYGFELIDYRDSIWEGVEKYFPEDEAIPILGDYICENDEVIKGVYGGYNVFPARYPIECLCERFEKDLPTLDKFTVSRLREYMDRCYPELKASHRDMQITDWDREITDRTYQGLRSILKGSEGFASPAPVYEEKFRGFFLGTTSKSAEFKRNMIDWSIRTDSDKAFRLLEQAVNSKEDPMVQAALYAYSFYPTEHTNVIIERLKVFAAQDKYPEYLYAAYSLATSNPKERVVWNACAKSTDFHLRAIQERGLIRYQQDFAFNTLLTIDLCGKVGDGTNYKKLLNIIVPSYVVGRYESFQKDLERIISTYDIKLDELIKQLFNSNNAVEIILGIRIGELKNHTLSHMRLKTLLNHDNSYVRLAVAKYVKERKERYRDLFEDMKGNSNRKVRSLASG